MLRNTSCPPFFALLGILFVASSCRGPIGSESTGPEPTRVDQTAPPLYEGGSEAPGQAAASSAAPADAARLSIEETARDAAAAAAQAKPKASVAALRREANRIMDDWHDAASVGDRDRYIDHFSLDAVFMGTDATERWDLATFTAYVEKYFRDGKGWTYTPSNRWVTLGPNELVAWFDEELESAGYGALRGTGVLRRTGDTWKLAHYSMTFAIPNEVSKDVVEIVRDRTK